MEDQKGTMDDNYLTFRSWKMEDINIVNTCVHWHVNVRIFVHSCEI